MANSTAAWRPDTLPEFEAMTLGPATLVRLETQPPQPRAAVLHVHGRNDYFFHSHVAHALADNGFAFYAVDMRRAGRSLREDDIPHHMESIAELGEDIGAAVAAVAAAHPELPVVIHAHSTGALAAVIWAAASTHPRLAGIALNSPLFGLRLRFADRTGMVAVPLLARRNSTRIIARPTSVYAGRLHTSNGGRWDFDLAWKRPQGVPVTAGWMASVRSAQRQIARGIDVPCPVMLARSDSTGPESMDNPLVDHQDTVVDVDAIARLGAHIRADVTHVIVERGIHDLTLSADQPRATYMDALLAWLDRVTT